MSTTLNAPAAGTYRMTTIKHGNGYWVKGKRVQRWRPFTVRIIGCDHGTLYVIPRRAVYRIEVAA